MTEEKTK